MFGLRSKHFPYLADYLQYAMQTPSDLGKRVGLAGAALGVLGALIGASFGILAGTGAIRPDPPMIASLVIGINALVFGGTGFAYAHEKRKMLRENKDAVLLNQARQASQVFYISCTQNRLHRSLHPAVGELLEAAARNWKRIRDAADGGFWTGKEVPDHWKLLRQQALQSADRGMAELMLMFRNEVRKPDPHDWQESIASTLENFGISTGGSSRQFDHLPVEFEAARDVAMKLGLLADEVEKVSREVMQTQEISVGLNSSRNIEDTLSEIRTIREAEAELRQNL